MIYDLDSAKVDRACAEFYKVFSVHDAQLYEEKYNLLNAFLAAVPGNHAFNLRYLYLLNTNYADFSFLFTLHCGEPRNRHLRQEYLAVLETNHHTPYFLNLHYRDVAHTMILGRTGAGKSFLLNFLITNLQKYDAVHVHLRPGRQLREPHASVRRLVCTESALNRKASRSTRFHCHPPRKISIFWRCS